MHLPPFILSLGLSCLGSAPSGAWKGFRDRGSLEGQVEAGTVTVPRLPWPRLSLCILSGVSRLLAGHTGSQAELGVGFQPQPTALTWLLPSFFTLGLFQAGQRAFPKRNEAQPLAYMYFLPQAILVGGFWVEHWV